MIIFIKDSIYAKHLATNLDCSEDEIYEKNGWAWECYK